MKATNIEWDTDGDTSIVLPSEIEIPDGITDEDEISDYISDVTGFCHKGFYIDDEAAQVVSMEKLNTHPTEAIVLRFNFNDIALDDMREVFESIKAQFPNNVVLAIPDYLSLESCSKDVLENIISYISEVIDNL